MPPAGAAPPSSLLDETEWLIAVLRVPALAVLLLARTMPHPNPEPEWFPVTLAAFGLWAAFALVWTFGRQVGLRFVLVATGLDIAFFTALTALSGGPFSHVRFAYLFVPVVVAFRMIPWLSALAGAAVVIAYTVQGVSHPAFALQEAGRVVTVFAAFLLWVGIACLLLSALLDRRRAQVRKLLEERTLLLSQVLDAEERERRRLAESLHDGALQTLLAARQDLEEAERGIGAPRALRSVTATIHDLRSAVYELHPYVLDEVGLAAAVTRIAESTAARSGLELELEVEPAERSASDTMLFSLARELLVNVVRHAGAGRLRVTLATRDGSRLLRVEDDGRGIDPIRLAQRSREGHIGLASQRARIEAAGGSLEIVTAPGAGTTIEALVPS